MCQPAGDCASCVPTALPASCCCNPLGSSFGIWEQLPHCKILLSAAELHAGLFFFFLFFSSPEQLDVLVVFSPTSPGLGWFLSLSWQQLGLGCWLGSSLGWRSTQQVPAQTNESYPSLRHFMLILQTPALRVCTELSLNFSFVPGVTSTLKASQTSPGKPHHGIPSWKVRASLSTPRPLPCLFSACCSRGDPCLKCFLQ